MKKRLLSIMMCVLLLVQVGCKKDEELPAVIEEEVIATESEIDEKPLVETEDVASDPINEKTDTPTLINLNSEQISKNDALFKDFSEKEKEPIWIFVDFKDVGDWSGMPTPPISPLGSQSVYVETEYEEDDVYTLQYIDEQQTVRERLVYGQRWEMSIPEDGDLSKEENLQMLYDYRRFIESLGGIAFNEYRNAATYYYFDGSDHIWVEIELSSHKLVTTVLKERRFDVNETIVIKPAEVDGNEITYSILIPDDKFVSLVSSIDSGRAYIDLKMKTAYGDYTRLTRINTPMNDIEGLNFVDDDYINEPGIAHMTISWNNNFVPNEIKMMVEAKYDVEAIVYGEQLGGITLSADHVSSVEINPTIGDDLSIKHPAYDEDRSYFDKNQEEAFVTFVPAGYYELEIVMKDGIVDKFRTLKVPVHSGKMTEVIVPQSLTDAVKNKAATEEEGIFISEVIEDGDQVSFVFSLIDSKTKEVSPDMTNSEIFEGGAACDIVSIEPIPTPPNIVVLLDSSGSMKGQMEQTIEAAKAFVDGLPNNTKLTIVDFDTEPKTLSGNSLSELRSQLDTVKANGATALYDSVIMGLDILEGQERPTLVVFTDGEDANYNDTARGSKATLDQALAAIDGSDVPLYTIGFGDGHDSSTLEVFAERSLGKYYSAEDQDALIKVFDSINEKLGNTYLATYERPTASSISDIPVVSFVIDVSGSMYNSFDSTTGYRLDDVKVIYHDFLQKLPEDVQVMITSFNEEVTIQQGITTDRMLGLNAIGNLEAGGGTNILGSVEYGYESLKKVASSKKIMIYLTDAALEVDDEDEGQFIDKLEAMKNDNIQTLWVGMGVADQTPFEKAAELSGGDFIVSEDAQVLADKFRVMLDEVKEAKGSSKTAITYNIKKKSEEGAFDSFSSSILYELAPVKRSDEVVVLDTITYNISELENVKQYDRLTSQYVTGDAIPGEDTIITRRIPTDVMGENEAASVQIDEIIFADKLTGVEAPKGQRFMGVLMDLTHILPEQEVVVYPDGSGHPSSWANGNNKGEVKNTKIPYSIPSFVAHFGMSYNAEGPFPAATATWLTYEPVVVPGVYDITLQPNESKKGMMVFIVPDEPLDQLGIHFFDDNYGHIDMPVVGLLPEIKTTFSAETKPAVKLLDNFSLEIKEYHVENVLDEPIEGSQHRMVKANFNSDVKAVINVEPSEAIYMKFNTGNGDFYSPLSTTTAGIPFGFYSPRAISPGGRNPIAMTFQMPITLENNKSELFLDLRDEDFVTPVSSGAKFEADVKGSFSTDYFTADVNNVSSFTGKISGINRTWIMADVTIHDKKDGFATRGATNNFYCDYLVSGESEEKKEIVKPTSLNGFAASNTYGYGGELRFLHRLDKSVGISNYTEDLLLGLDQEAIVYDGTSRRGLLLFVINGNEENQTWQLKFDDTELQVDVVQGLDEAYDALLVEREEYEVDYRYEENLPPAIDRAIAAYKLRYPDVERTSIANDDIYDDVNMPSASAYGYQLASQIESVSDLENTIRSLRFINPGGATYFKYLFSKEALLTQGFGTEGDFANLAIEMLSRLGYKTKRLMVVTTDKGKEILSQMSGVEVHQINKLPALSYVNQDGEKKVMVLPFGRNLSDLQGLVYYDGDSGDYPNSDKASLTIYYDLLPTEEGHLAQLNNMAGALGGASSEVSITRENIENFRLSNSMLSKDAIDIGTAVIGNKAYPIIYTAEGPMMSEEYIDLNYYGIRGMGIKINDYDHYVQITEDMEVNQVFMTLGYNLPEIPEAAAQLINTQMAESQNLQADTLSALQWLHRQSIYSFIASQTTFERGMEEGLNLVTGRVRYPRALVVQSVMDEQLVMSMDLLHIQNDLHTGSKEEQNSYRLMSGLSASQLEAKVLENGHGFEEIWALMPEDADLVLFDSNDLDIHMEHMIEAGMTEEMIEYFDDLRKMVLIQSAPSMIDGKPRWAWLEIDKYDYETISVIDTFEHGSMSSNATLNSALEKAQYIIGAFKGVETSVWSMSAFTMILINYDDVKQAAMAFALGIGENFEAEIGSIKLSAGKVPELTGPAKDVKDFFDKEDKDDDSKGFKEGYKDGVELYFKVAK